MAVILLVIHLVLAISLVIVVLLQRSEGGALGIGGGGGGGMFTARGSANILTRATGIIAAMFLITSLSLAIISGNRREPSSVLDTIPVQQAPVSSEPAIPVSE